VAPHHGVIDERRFERTYCSSLQEQWSPIAQWLGATFQKYGDLKYAVTNVWKLAQVVRSFRIPYTFTETCVAAFGWRYSVLGKSKNVAEMVGLTKTLHIHWERKMHDQTYRRFIYTSDGQTVLGAGQKEKRKNFGGP